MNTKKSTTSNTTAGGSRYIGATGEITQKRLKPEVEEREKKAPRNLERHALDGRKLILNTSDNQQPATERDTQNEPIGLFEEEP